MNPSVTSRITQAVQDALDTTNFFFEEIHTSKNYFETAPITEDSFSQIAKSHVNMPFLFIDGGQATLFQSPSLCVSAIRIAAVKSELQYIDTIEVLEYAVIVRLKKNTNEKLAFMIEYIPLSDVAAGYYAQYQLATVLPTEILYDDEFFSQTQDHQKAFAVSGFIRRILEITFADYVVQEKQLENVAVVLDGSLQCKHTQELRALQGLFQSMQQKNGFVCGLSKTSQYVTTSGFALNAFLDRTAPQNTCWQIHDILKPKTQQYPADIYFVKLHAKSKYVFKLDVQKGTDIDMQKLFGMLIMYSYDPTFLGYPYPLIKVDDVARIDNKEKEYLQIRLFSNIDELTRKQLEALQASVDAHGVLDGMRF